MPVTRKHLVIGIGVLVLAVVIIAIAVVVATRDDKTDHQTRLDRVKELLAETPVIDG